MVYYYPLFAIGIPLREHYYPLAPSRGKDARRAGKGSLYNFRLMHFLRLCFACKSKSKDANLNIFRF